MKILKILGSRVIVVGLILTLQVLWFLFFIFRLGSYSTIVNAIFTIISILVVLYIVNRNDNPGFKLAWIVPILLFPVMGGVLYLFIGAKKPAPQMRNQLQKVLDLTNPYFYQKKSVLDEIEEKNPSVACEMRYLERTCGYPVYKNTESTYFSIGEEYFEVLLSELKKAKHYIFMEFFIVERGYMWDSILEVLEQKVKEGVEVRFMYDDVGCVTLLPYHYYKQLEAKGIQTLAFNPFIPIFSIAMNNRDHRKITVIDGHTGFTGGINLADEYINRKERFGHWKDTGIMIKGEGVWNLTVMFLQMWNAFRPTESDYLTYRPHRHAGVEFLNDGYVLPYGDSPLDGETIGENVYLNMINSATRYVYITTPYLITDNEMITALSLAAKRGVDVRIITPGVPDKKLVFMLTQSYYPVLIEAGVKIFEYTPGFIHAKSMVCDDVTAIVGTINLDYRSLYLHFENGIFLYGTKSVAKVKEDFLNTMDQSCPITNMTLDQGFIRGVFRAVLRLLSPLM